MSSSTDIFVPKAFRSTWKKLKKQGWTYEDDRRHGVLVSPDGTSRVTVSRGTDQAPRNIRNVMAQLRRAGADL